MPARRKVTRDVLLDAQREGLGTSELARILGVTPSAVSLACKRQGLRLIDKRAEQALAQWHDPEFRQRTVEAMRAKWQDPEFRRRKAEAMRAKWQDAEFRRLQAEGTRAHLEARWRGAGGADEE